MALSDIFSDEGSALPLGLALMRMGGRSNQPRNLGVELGTAFEQQAKMQQAKQQQMMQQLQMDQIKRAILKDKNKEGYQEQLAQLMSDPRFNKPAVPGTPETTQFEQPLMTQGMGGEQPQLPSITGSLSGIMGNQPPQPTPNLATQTVPGTPGQPASFDYQGMAQAALPLMERLKPGSGFEYAMQNQKAQEDRTFKAAELKQKYNDRLNEIKLKAEEGRISREEADKRMIEARKDIAQLAASLKQQGGDGSGKTPVYYIDDKPGSPTFGQAIVGNLQDARGKRGANYSPDLQGNLSSAKTAGKGMGEAVTNLNAAEASLPQLEKTVGQLKDLSEKATYTLAGQGRDAVARQFNTTTDGAVAREKYVQTVRDVLFPQLRATFGAQFTVKEGEALVATLGDPNKNPRERVAALEAFIDQKKQHIQSLRRQTSTSSTPNNDPLGLR